ncbi:MAG: hypothetical protein MPJ53_02135 [Alphaproteobacteria bacterium]|nr:hypothetical protein [Alphaproteobacteria bacterium]MDA7989652.1 hypothetical protein [Gammaproteobacteria bacterium]
MTCVGDFKEACREAITGDPGDIVRANSFVDLASRIGSKYPLLYLPDFLDDFMRGMFTKNIISKYHIPRSVSYQTLVNDMIKMPGRRTKSASGDNTDANMENKDFATRYMLLSGEARKFMPQLRQMLHTNILRMVLAEAVLEKKFITGAEMVDVVLSTYERISDRIKVLADAHARGQFEDYIKKDLDLKLHHITEDLAADSYITAMHGDISVPNRYSKIRDHVFELIHGGMEGLSYNSVKVAMLRDFPLFKLGIGMERVDDALRSLEGERKIIRKSPLLKRSAESDQFYSTENYDRIMKAIRERVIQAGHTKFFGRRISPKQFIEEVVSLDPGSLQDQDDQVTRIAGLLLCNGALLQDPGGAQDFDFVADFTSHSLRKRQVEVARETGLDLASGLLYCKVMIGGSVTARMLKGLRGSVPDGGRAVVFTCKPVRLVAPGKAGDGPPVMVADKDAIHKWAGITPTIPCRKGSIARVRYGDDAGRVARITSLNYETGSASVVMYPDGREADLPIGSMEEVEMHASSQEDLEDATERYDRLLHEMAGFAPSFVEGLAMDVVAVYADRADMLRSTRPELFDDQHPPLPEETEEEEGGRIVMFENANVDMLKLECSCSHRINETHYRTLCPHEVAALNHVSTSGAGDLGSCMARMAESMRKMRKIRESNVARMSDAIYDALDTVPGTWTDPKRAFIGYLEYHLNS